MFSVHKFKVKFKIQPGQPAILYLEARVGELWEAGTLEGDEGGAVRGQRQQRLHHQTHLGHLPPTSKGLRVVWPNFDTMP